MNTKRNTKTNATEKEMRKSFAKQVKTEKEISKIIENAINDFLIEMGIDCLPENFECFLLVDSNGASLVSCG